jgi:hypothetical protein
MAYDSWKLSRFAWVLVILAGASCAARADTLKVGPTQTYKTIQSAIVAASDGDTVLVDAGTYPEAIDFLVKNITVQGCDLTHPEKTVIDDIGSPEAVNLTSKDIGASEFCGFKVLNKEDMTDISVGPGSVTIHNCILAQAEFGIQVGDLCSPTITCCTFDGNSDGINTGPAGAPVISQCLFENCQHDGICLGGDGTVTDCVVNGGHNEHADITQSGVEAVHPRGRVVLTRLYTTGCRAMGITAVGQATIQGCLTTDNGWGFLLSGADQVVNCTCANNHHGLRAEVGSVTLKNCLVTGNSEFGVSSYRGATVSLSYCDVYNEDAANYDGMDDQTGTNGNISVDPLLVGPYCRLSSSAGLWDDATSAWVTVDQTSPCIDAGDPASPFDQEPAPNGGRINMGWDGNTAHTSKSGGPVAAPAPQ